MSDRMASQRWSQQRSAGRGIVASGYCAVKNESPCPLSRAGAKLNRETEAPEQGRFKGFDFAWRNHRRDGEGPLSIVAFRRPHGQRKTPPCKDEHNALADARWNRDVYRSLMAHSEAHECSCDREQVAETLRAVQESHQELLAALKDMEKWADVCCDTMSLAQAKEYLRIREAARAAIARAEGR